MIAPLTISRRDVGPVVILALTGRLKFDEDGDLLLRDQVAAVVASGDQNILLDLHGVHQMDSGGVGTLVAVYLHVAKRGGKLKLVHPSERVRRVLHMTHLEEAFEVFENETDALRTFDGAVAGNREPRPDPTRTASS
jgi:anti-sigma B factor antagonist